MNTLQNQEYKFNYPMQVIRDVSDEARNASRGLNITEGSSSSSSGVFGRTFSGFGSVFSLAQPANKR